MGQKYFKKLSHTENQINQLDRLSFNNNVFNEIEYCRIQILKQFLRTLDFLKKIVSPLTKLTNLFWMSLQK